jgi:hypothetical protein
MEPKKIVLYPPLAYDDRVAGLPSVTPSTTGARIRRALSEPLTLGIVAGRAAPAAAFVRRLRWAGKHAALALSAVPPPAVLPHLGF